MIRIGTRLPLAQIFSERVISSRTLPKKMVALARCSATASGGSSHPAVPAAHGHGSGHVAEAHGHDHHHEPFEVPDYRLFNVDGIPQLDDLRNKLAAEGLRDYWIRYLILLV